MGSFLGLRKGTERRKKETLWVVVGHFSMIKALSWLWLVVSLLPKLSKLWLSYSIAKALCVVVSFLNIEVTSD
ncbi:hypothetical protein AMTRI_Chr13g117520 [Amborella trichopoda]